MIYTDGGSWACINGCNEGPPWSCFLGCALILLILMIVTLPVWVKLLQAWGILEPAG